MTAPPRPRRAANRPPTREVSTADGQNADLLAAIRLGWNEVRMGVPPPERGACSREIQLHVERGRQFASVVRARIGDVPIWPADLGLLDLVRRACPEAIADLAETNVFFLRGASSAAKGEAR